MEIKTKKLRIILKKGDIYDYFVSIYFISLGVSIVALISNITNYYPSKHIFTFLSLILGTMINLKFHNNLKKFIKSKTGRGKYG